MQLQELLSKIKRIEIKSNALSNHIFAGDYNTAFKGRGMSFAEVREYNYGDDIRNIDWNVSARFGHPYIKMFQEERELTFLLLIDVSDSNLFGTQWYSKQQLIAELSATLAFSAIKNNDKVGAIFFSGYVECYMPPKKGKSNILQILRKILTIQPKHKSQTNVSAALQYLDTIQKRKTVSFLISDFNSSAFDKYFGTVIKKHKMHCIHVYDKTEREMPDIGLVHTIDLESGQAVWVDTSKVNNRNLYRDQFDSYYNNISKQIKKFNAKWLSISTSEDYTKKLHSFFKHG
jgi:uncharacterized protein (DUF58 family)